MRKRSLPLQASQLLTEMLAHIRAKKQVALAPSTVQMIAHQKHIEMMRRENEYQRIHTARKIAVIQKHETRRERAAMFIDYLQARLKKEHLQARDIYL